MFDGSFGIQSMLVILASSSGFQLKVLLPTDKVGDRNQLSTVLHRDGTRYLYIFSLFFWFDTSLRYHLLHLPSRCIHSKCVCDERRPRKLHTSVPFNTLTHNHDRPTSSLWWYLFVALCTRCSHHVLSSIYGTLEGRIRWLVLSYTLMEAQTSPRCPWFSDQPLLTGVRLMKRIP